MVILTMSMTHPNRIFRESNYFLWGVFLPFKVCKTFSSAWKSFSIREDTCGKAHYLSPGSCLQRHLHMLAIAKIYGQGVGQVGLLPQQVVRLVYLTSPSLLLVCHSFVYVLLHVGKPLHWLGMKQFPFLCIIGYGNSSNPWVGRAVWLPSLTCHPLM